MSRSPDLRIVMIGCGQFARRYHMPSIETDPRCRIAAIFDPTPTESTVALAATHGAALVDRMEALSIPEGPAMAIVTTPHTLHAKHVRFAIERGWHVLCDKPFVMHVSEARELADAAARKGIVNAVAFNRRFDRGCLEAKRLIRDGSIGRVRYLEAVQLGYERAGWFLVPGLGGGGPFTGRASHITDLLPWLVDERPTRARGRLRGDGGERADRGGFIDIQFGELEGRLTCIEEGWHMWDEVRIFGEQGMIELRRPLTVPIGWELWHWSDRYQQHTHLAADATPGGATRNFLAAIREGSPVGCTFADACVSVEVMEAAFNSARSGEDWVELSGAHRQEV